MSGTYNTKNLKEITKEYFIKKVMNSFNKVIKEFGVDIVINDESKKRFLDKQLKKFEAGTYDIGTLAPCIVNVKVVEYDNELWYMNLKTKELYRYEY